MKAEIIQFLIGTSFWGRSLRLLILLYIALNAFAFLLAERFIFRPPLPTYQDNANILKLTTRNGKQISALYLENPKAVYTILYSHGNGSDLGMIEDRLKILHRMGFSVFAYDYQGYGTSQGTPSEQNTYRDIKAAYNYLTNTLQVAPNHIVLYGFSVGSGPSIELATHKQVAGLVLEGAFTSTFRVATNIPLVPFDRFNNIAKIKSLQSPILFIHGTHDEVIPFHQGKMLYQQANPPKQFLTIEGAYHNNVLEVGGRDYEEAIKEFVEGLAEGKRQWSNFEL